MKKCPELRFKISCKKETKKIYLKTFKTFKIIFLYIKNVSIFSVGQLVCT